MLLLETVNALIKNIIMPGQIIYPSQLNLNKIIF